MLNKTTDRISAFEDFERVALPARALDSPGFTELVSEACRLLELTDQQIADELMVSRPTVSRWKAGKNLPHRALRGPISKALVACVAKRRRLLERQQQQEQGSTPTHRVRQRPAARSAVGS